MLNDENKIIIQLASISPIDGRYYSKTKELRSYFSEYAFFRYRLHVEIAYLIDLLNKLIKEKEIESININEQLIAKLNIIVSEFSMKECIKIKEIESKINHDVKAIEYYIQNKITEMNLPKYINSFIHFGLTSQDINNTALPMMIKHTIENIYIESLENIQKCLDKKATNWKDVVIISKTHGQPATPTTFGKEMRVFHYRIAKQLKLLKNHSYYGKMGGATGNLNAHICAYPNINWKEFISNFLSKFELVHNEYTTQIDNYENLSTIFDNLKN